MSTDVLSIPFRFSKIEPRPPAVDLPVDSGGHADTVVDQLRGFGFEYLDLLDVPDKRVESESSMIVKNAHVIERCRAPSRDLTAPLRARGSDLLLGERCAWRRCGRVERRLSIV